MELRQLRYFIRVVEHGSFTRAAADLQVVQSALSLQVTRLESELSTRLLLRTPKGVTPTEAGMAFLREAQLTIRHADQAARAAQESHLSGAVSIGLPPTVSAVLGMPLMQAMRERYPDVRLHLVESLSGHLASQLNARQLDLAVLYGSHAARRWNVSPLLEERLYFIQSARHPLMSPMPEKLAFHDLGGSSLIIPSPSHGLRTLIDAGFSRARVTPSIGWEIDSLSMLMDAVDAGLGGTVQPAIATARYADARERFQLAEIVDREAIRLCSLCSLSNDEISPAALAARVVLSVCARDLVRSSKWPGAATNHHA